MFLCKTDCIDYVLRKPKTTEVGYLTKQTIYIKPCSKIQNQSLSQTTCWKIFRAVHMCTTQTLHGIHTFQIGGEIWVEGFKSSIPTSSSRTHTYVEYVRHVFHVIDSARLQISYAFQREFQGKRSKIRRMQDWFLHQDKVPASMGLCIQLFLNDSNLGWSHTQP
jgi:hypothetical protein